MSSPITDKALDDLYSKRKNQLQLPELSSVYLPNVPKKNVGLYKKMPVIFSLSLIASFSIFALITHLLPNQEKIKLDNQTTVKYIPVELNTINKVKVNTIITPKTKVPLIIKNTVPPSMPKVPKNIIEPTLIVITPLTLNNSKVSIIMPKVDKAEITVLLKYRTLPKYPAIAAKKRIEGMVKMGFNIDAQGSVKDIFVLSASPSNTFERSAKKALKGWKYQIPENQSSDWIRKNNVVEFNFKLESK